MHRRRVVAWLMVLSLIASFLVASTAAAQPQQESGTYGTKARDVTRETAEAYVARWAKTDHPEWENASIEDPQAYYDLEGNHIATVYTITDGRNPVGYINAGAGVFQGRVFEAGPGEAPASRTASEVRQALGRDLNLNVSDSDIFIDKPLYLGAFQYFHVVEVGEEKYGIDYLHNKAVHVSELKSNLVKPTQPPQAGIEPINATTSDYYNISDVPSYHQEASNDCGPTAGCNIVCYYKLCQGYSNLDVYPHDTLMETMNTGWWGTLADDARDGFIEYTNTMKGYSFSASLSGYLPNLLTVKDRLQNDHPLMLLFDGASYALWHWVTVRGYDIIDDFNRYLIVNDPSGGRVNAYVDWNANFGSMNFVYITD